MKIVKIDFTEHSKQDYDCLSPNLRAECNLLLKKLKKVGHTLGKPLANKNGKDLRGYYKLYFDEARYRIVYKITDEQIVITEIGETLKEFIEITGIGKRDMQYIYDLIWQRISEK